jgi:MoaA/NifB/PqqE/SkfB family radical SAM enzyme
MATNPLFLHLKDKKAKSLGLDYLPAGIQIINTVDCESRCKQCAYGSLRKENPGELSQSDIENIVGQALELSVRHFLFIGSEPKGRHHKDLILNVAEKFPQAFFDPFSGGQFPEHYDLERMQRLGNVNYIFSIEGLSEYSDKRRGCGSLERTEETIAAFKHAKIPFSLSVTLTKENYEHVTSNNFLEYVGKFKPFFVFFLPYVPMGEEPRMDLVLSKEEKFDFDKKVGQINKDGRYAMWFMTGADYEPVDGMCRAGDRNLAILPNGTVVPCGFMHIGVDNIKDKSCLLLK